MLQQNPFDGLVVLGGLSAADFEEWDGFVTQFTETLRTLAASEGVLDESSYGVEGFAENLGFIDISVNE